MAVTAVRGSPPAAALFAAGLLVATAACGAAGRSDHHNSASSGIRHDVAPLQSRLPFLGTIRSATWIVRIKSYDRDPVPAPASNRLLGTVCFDARDAASLARNHHWYSAALDHVDLVEPTLLTAGITNPRWIESELNELGTRDGYTGSYLLDQRSGCLYLLLSK
ncbi:MAG: hypothetical protein QOI35_3833 [Cryptosporangiaceae bacterium]|nr:hypothetical protein [Cryptosporangiaceae bacterium]MDQ1658688.1 hypothetical protein [Cryptosporangiaceae bacterium]